MFADYHVHTSFSDDSEYEMEEVIKRAIQLGIEELCFTDHEDYLTNDIEQTHLVDYDAYEKRYRELKEKYAEQITLKFGMEFGIQSHMIQEFERDFVAHDFDFILLSNHQINDQEFWTGEFQKGKNQLEINSQYYEAILDVMGKYHNYSVLAHLDMIKRYDPYGILEDSICEEVIKQILKKAIKEGKGIEVNTSYVRYNLPTLTPSPTILKWYLELGGKILTIGSDSHEESHLGAYIEDTKKQLKELGFKEFCTFDKMKPIFHKL